jgi:hypothetical protein
MDLEVIIMHPRNSARLVRLLFLLNFQAFVIFLFQTKKRTQGNQTDDTIQICYHTH